MDYQISEFLIISAANFHLADVTKLSLSLCARVCVFACRWIHARGAAETVEGSVLLSVDAGQTTAAGACPDGS